MTMMTTRMISPLSQIPARYPNLVRAVSWTASISPIQARYVVWAHVNHIGGTIGSHRVAAFGSTRNLIAQAVKYRNA